MTRVLIAVCLCVLMVAPATADAAKGKGKKKSSSITRLSTGDLNTVVPEELPDDTDGFVKLPLVGGKKLKGKEVADVDVNLRATGEVGTLSARLTAPNGASSWLLFTGDTEGSTIGSGPASCAGSFLTYADETPMFTGTSPFLNPFQLPPPYVGRVQPDGGTPLFVMDGSKAKGTWTVTLLDDDDAQGQATVNCVQVLVKTRMPLK